MEEAPQPNVDCGGGGVASSAIKVAPCDPLSLLSEDMWIKIIGYLDANPRDLLNVGETCRYFADLLDRELPAGRGADHGACSLEEILPLVLPYIPAEKLALRSVCRRVRDTTDRVLECRDLVTPRQNQGFFPWLTPPPPLDPARDESFEWKRFAFCPSNPTFDIWPAVRVACGPGLKPLEWLREHQTFLDSRRQSMREENGRVFRFVGKKVCAVCADFVNLGDALGPDTPDDVTFLQEVLDFCAANNNDIQALEVSVYEIAPLEYYDLFREVVSSVPALSSLELFDYEEREAEDYSSEEELEFLRAHMNTNLLPEAPNLQKLTVHCSPPFLRHLSIAYWETLKVLKITLDDPWWYLDWTGYFAAPREYHFPSLEFLSVELAPHSFATLRGIRAPILMTLEVVLYPEPNDENFPERLLDLSLAVHSFPSVTNLLLKHHLTLPQSTGREVEFEQRNVRKLAVKTCLSTFGSAPSLKCYISLFPNIEEIIVVDEKPFTVEGYVNDEGFPVDDSDIRLLKEGQLRESTIWTEAESLLVVTEESREMLSGAFLRGSKNYRPRPLN